MTTYKYKGVSSSGVDVEGIVDAFDEIDALERVKDKCSIVTGITQVKEPLNILQKELFGKIKPKTLSVVCSQFSIILSAGLPIVRSVSLIADQTTDKTMKRILKDVAGDVAGGTSLAKSFESKGGKMLPVTFIETIRAGEESGTLEKSFVNLSIFFEKESKTKGKVKSAMAYPMFLLVLSVAVVGVCLVYIVPMLVDTFAQMDMELPITTKMLISLSDFLMSYWWVLLIIVVLLIIFFKYTSSTVKGKLIYSKIALWLPLLGGVKSMEAASQFSNTMATLLGAGLTIVRALEITSRVTTNQAVSDMLSVAVADVVSGKRLSDSIRKDDYYPGMLCEIVSVGEESGTLENVLQVMGTFYDEEFQTKTNKMVKTLEPTILCVMGGLVAFILLSIYGPIFSMYQGM